MFKPFFDSNPLQKGKGRRSYLHFPLYDCTGNAWTKTEEALVIVCDASIFLKRVTAFKCHWLSVLNVDISDLSFTNLCRRHTFFHRKMNCISPVRARWASYSYSETPLLLSTLRNPYSQVVGTLLFWDIEVVIIVEKNKKIYLWFLVGILNAIIF